MNPASKIAPELSRVHEALVEALHGRGTSALAQPFTVAEIYQDLIPYRTHRDLLGVAMNGDYEHLLLRLLSGEGGLVELESEAACEAFAAELRQSHPNTGLFRDYAGLDVRLAGVAGLAVSDAPQARLFDDDAGSAAEGDVPEAAESSVHEAPAPESSASASPALAASPPAAAANRDDQVSSACAWCEADLPRRDDLKFCPYCGHDVAIVPCSSCRAPLEPDWRFCIACGQSV